MDLKDLADVRMADFAGVPHFTWQVAAVCELGALKGDAPIKFRIVRFVNDAHSASSHLAQNVEESPIEDVARVEGVVRCRRGEQRSRQRTLRPLFLFDAAPNLFEERAISAAGSRAGSSRARAQRPTKVADSTKIRLKQLVARPYWDHV